MATQQGRHDPYAAFRSRDFRLFTVGSLVAQVTTAIQTIAFGWEIYQRTGEALALGLVGAAEAIPMLAFSLPAGYLADRVNRRTLLILSCAGATLTSLLLAVVSFTRGPVALMYAVLFVDASVLTLGRPARQALMAQLVPPKDFANAVTWRSSTWQVSAMAGPALGGIVIAFNSTVAYLLSAMGTVVLIVCLLNVRTGHVQEPARVSPLESLKQGLSFLRVTPILLVVMALDMFAVLLGGAVYLLPVFAKEILFVGPRGYGWLAAAPGIGAFGVAMLLAHRPPMKNAGRSMLLSVAGFGLATIVFGLSRNYALSFVMLFLTGALDNVSVVVRHTLVQMLTPDRMRGRVSAVNSIFIGSSNQLGGLESGVVAHFFGPLVSVVSGGLGTIVVVVAIALGFPRMLDVKRLDEVTPEERSET